MAQPIRILVVDDSPAQLALLVRILQRTGTFTVVGTACTGREAIAAVERLRPQVVAMDVHLPGIDGYEATRQIMERWPTPIVLVSARESDASERTMLALAAGALAVVRKPDSLALFGDQGEQEAFLTALRLMAGVRVVTRYPRRTLDSATPAARSPFATATRPELLVVAASTGGPAAVQVLLAGLGSDFPLPVLVVQHITRGFTQSLATWLSSVVPLSVHLARPEQPLVSGRAYLAPDDLHLVVAGPGRLNLEPSGSGDRYCPSANRLFSSAARVYGAHAIGVILTGMGDDGAQGLMHLRAAGALTLAQNEATSVVYGMPRAAVEAGAVIQSAALQALPLAILAALLRSRPMGAAPGTP
jgi:two-component system chemotaxis response regulator CheB